MLDNWNKRHGIWKLHKHRLPDVKPTTIHGSTLPSSGNSSDVVMKFMHDTLQLNLTLGHQITADTLPDVKIMEDLIYTQGDKAQCIKRKTKTISKVLHWTLLKIEFTNPSKLMLMQNKNQVKYNDGEDIKLAHYLLLRSLTPSRLAEQCPNTKHLENTLSMISEVTLCEYLLLDIRKERYRIK
jgi:hypothetical protein